MSVLRRICGVKIKDRKHNADIRNALSINKDVHGHQLQRHLIASDAFVFFTVYRM